MQRKSDYEVGGKEEHDKKTTQGWKDNLGMNLCIRQERWSGDGGFYPSMQRHYRRLIYYLYYIATCFGPMTIIRKKYINSLGTTETCSNII
jgi:hypothetical protein